MIDTHIACCFFRAPPEIPSVLPNGDAFAAMMKAPWDAAKDGYRLFVTGMSRGFDLWAKTAPQWLRKELPVQLLCAVPFDTGRLDRGLAHHTKVLLQADLVQSLSHKYTPDCYFVRNRFMVEGCNRLICWYDGRPGGTKFTVHCAKRRGLELVNLADRQLSLF